MACSTRIVDWMPVRLWRSGNLVILPGGDLHFCTAEAIRDSSVRTVEWNGTEVARGRAPATYSHLGGEGAVIFVPVRQVVAAAVAVGLLLVGLVWRRRPSQSCRPA